jgi:hypothetical protein
MSDLSDWRRIEDLEHQALDPRSLEEWGHSVLCDYCRWELMKRERIHELNARIRAAQATP